MDCFRIGQRHASKSLSLSTLGSCKPNYPYLLHHIMTKLFKLFIEASHAPTPSVKNQLEVDFFIHIFTVMGRENLKLQNLCFVIDFSILHIFSLKKLPYFLLPVVCIVTMLIFYTVRICHLQVETG